MHLLLNWIYVAAEMALQSSIYSLTRLQNRPFRPSRSLPGFITKTAMHINISSSHSVHYKPLVKMKWWALDCSSHAITTYLKFVPFPSENVSTDVSQESAIIIKKNHNKISLPAFPATRTGLGSFWRCKPDKKWSTVRPREHKFSFSKPTSQLRALLEQFQNYVNLSTSIKSQAQTQSKVHLVRGENLSFNDQALNQNNFLL